MDLIGSLRLHQADSAFLANSAVTRAETQHKPPGTYMDDFVFVLSVYFLLRFPLKTSITKGLKTHRMQCITKIRRLGGKKAKSHCIVFLKTSKILETALISFTD